MDANQLIEHDATAEHSHPLVTDLFSLSDKLGHLWQELNATDDVASAIEIQRDIILHQARYHEAYAEAAQYTYDLIISKAPFFGPVSNSWH